MSAADDVKKAWTVPGRSPAYHREQQRLLHDRWPVLFEAIEKLVREKPAVVNVSIVDEPHGPTPALFEGKPIIHVHPTAGSTYLAANGSGWWKAEAMPHPNVVERDRIADIIIAHGRDGIEGCRCGWAKLGKSHAAHVANVILGVEQS